MTDLRQAAQQALEFIPESGSMLGAQAEAKRIDAITALRTALEQQAEPVAYFDFQDLTFSWAKHMQIGPVPVSIKVEPVALYLEAPQPQAGPLKDWEFVAMWATAAETPADKYDTAVEFGRAVESRHGIKGSAA